MGQVLTNETGLAYARESSLGVLPGSPDWKQLEPNSIGTFGPSISTVPRSPISKLQQNRKGTITNLEAAADFEADMTMDSFADFAEALIFATAVNADMVFRAADTTGTGYTIPAATAAQAAKFQYTAAGPISLVHAAGYATVGNNSPQTYKPLSADVAVTDTEIQVAGLTIETAPTNAEVTLAGIRAEAGDLALAVASNIGTLTSGNGASVTPIDFTTLGLTAGQKIHVGGVAAANRFGSTAGGSNDSFGSARIRTIAAGTLTLDKLDTTLTASDGTDTGSAGSEVAVDLLFSRFIRNVAVDASDYIRISHHFEAAFPNLFETDPPTPLANPDGFEYVTGAVANELNWAMPLTDKSTASFGFVATGADDPVDNASRKSGAATAREPLNTGALNTSNDFFRLGVFDVDDTGLTSDFKDITAVLSNGVTPENVLGLLGARYVNRGNFVMTMQATALFTNPLVPARIRANTTVTADWLLTNDEGAISVDIPSATIGSDGKEYPVNATVAVDLQITAFVDPLFKTSIGVSLFPVFPTS